MMMWLPSTTLWTRDGALNRRPPASTRCFERTTAASLGSSYRIVGQTDLAEELAAEAFWKLHQRRPAHLTNAEGWLCRAGVRLALDALRKGKRRAHYESAAPSAADSPRNPEDDFARGEEQERVRQVLARMKSSHATLLMLRAEGLSYQELAATLRLHPASVGTMLARAEERFKREYERCHGRGRDGE